MTLYEQIRDAGIPTDSHESDLYVLATAEAIAMVQDSGLSASTFISQLDGRLWLDVAFAYDPWWNRHAVGVMKP